MTVIQLYTQLSSLRTELQKKVAEYIDFLKFRAKKSSKRNKKIAGLATGLISMKSNFDDPIEDFEDYM